MSTLTITQTDTVADVCRKLRAVLDEENLIDEYFCVSGMAERSFRYLSEGYRWIACYSVTGGSEGHYIHVDLIGGYDHDWSGKALLIVVWDFRKRAGWCSDNCRQHPVKSDTFPQLQALWSRHSVHQTAEPEHDRTCRGRTAVPSSGQPR